MLCNIVLFAWHKVIFIFFTKERNNLSLVRIYISMIVKKQFIFKRKCKINKAISLTILIVFCVLVWIGMNAEWATHLQVDNLLSTFYMQTGTKNNTLQVTWIMNIWEFRLFRRIELNMQQAVAPSFCGNF